MLKTSNFLILAGILTLTASCSSKHDPEESKGMLFKSTEVLVRQCPDINNMELNALFKEHDVEIKKQISPHLYVVTWSDDDRKADEVVQELKNTHKLCGVDKKLDE